MMCENNRNKIKYTNTLCKFRVFLKKVRSLATDVICVFIHYLVVEL